MWWCVKPSSSLFDINLIGSPTAIQILTNDQNKNTPPHVELKIQAWDKHKNVAVHSCACFKTYPGFPMQYVIVFFLCSTGIILVRKKHN
jgi:hypothetical protein